MTKDRVAPADQQQTSGNYLSVTRLDDGRFCVVFVSPTARRTSYAQRADLVVNQARRAGLIPISTEDGELRQLCQAQQVPLI